MLSYTHDNIKNVLYKMFVLVISIKKSKLKEDKLDAIWISC